MGRTTAINGNTALLLAFTLGSADTLEQLLPAKLNASRVNGFLTSRGRRTETHQG